MPYSHLIALTGYVDGREQDYNDWYTWVHLRDVMRLSLSVVAAQRFKATDALAAKGGSDFDFPYLCIYEVIDPEAMTCDHAPVFTDEMPISDAYDLSGASEVYFDEIATLTKRPGEHGTRSVIVERFGSAPCDPDVADWYVRERFARICELPGVISGSVGVANAHQMFEQPLSALCAVYWTDDIAATANSWTPLLNEPPSRLGIRDVSLNAYDAVIDRLTIAEVRKPTEGGRKTAAEVRTRLSDRLHSGPSPSVQSEHFA